jgi:hypothetical protein
MVARVVRTVINSVVLLSAGTLSARRANAQPVGLRYTMRALRGATGPSQPMHDLPVDSAPSANRVRASQADLPEKIKPSPWWAPVASAALPGSGQLALSQQRSVAYAVVEVYMLVQAVVAQRDADRQREQYQNLASEVARAQFGGSRPVGPWVTYYEPMEKFLESGAFSLVKGATVVPETDENTYNGSRWLLARQTYWRDPAVPPAVGSPEYARALAAYVKEAWPDEYRWSWRDAQLQWDVYRQLIASKNRSYQRANNFLGLVIANHLVSMVDAYVSVRIRRFGGAGLAGLQLDGVRSEISSVGDPAWGMRRLQTSIRIVPSSP